MSCYEMLKSLALLLWLLLPNNFKAMAFEKPPRESIMQHQLYIVLDLMAELNKIHNFDNIIIYRTRSGQYEVPPQTGLMLLTRNKHQLVHDEIIHRGLGNIITAHAFTPKLFKTVMIFAIRQSWNNSIPNLGTILTNNNLAVVLLNDIFNFDLMEFVALSLGASLETKIVFLLLGHEIANVPPLIRLEKLMRFFRWCWSKNMLNAILLFQKDHIEQSLKELKMEIYTYTPFPWPIKILQLTGQHPSEFFKDRVTDLKGYRFMTPVLNDKPRVFRLFDRDTGRESITGISGYVYMEYVKHINATFKEWHMPDPNISWHLGMQQIYDLLDTRKIDISIHPLSVLKPHHFFTSYPITNTNSCVVVPVHPEINPSLYIPRSLTVSMWCFLVILFICFQLAYALINCIHRGQIRAWHCFSFTLKGLLSMPLDNINTYKTISLQTVSCRRQLFIHMLLLLSGMIYCQTHLAALTSLLSSTLYPQQIESLDDLRKANISIMLVDSMYDVYNYLDLIPDNFSDHLVLTDSETVSYHLNRLDTSYAYTVYKEQWKVMQRLQVNLWRPRFKIVPQLCVPNVYLNLPMQFNSPFYHSLQKFILNAQSTGLEDKWSGKVFRQIQLVNCANGTIVDTLNHPAPLKLEHFTYVFYIYVAGLVMAFIAFLVELKWAKYCQKLKN